MRTLKQIALDYAHKFPLAADAIMSSFYMDDLLEGGDSISQLKQLQQDIIAILKDAGMNIRKWSSNSHRLIEDLPNDKLDIPLDFKHTESKKTLGISWVPASDTFVFKNIFKDVSNDEHLTKRQLSSNISKIFDPLGWLSPLTIRAKILFQRTWSEEADDWDSPISKDMYTILGVIQISCWQHVRSEDNSADCATRGLSTQQLSEHTLWWQGPKWLSSFDTTKINDHVYQPPEIETKRGSVSAAVSHKNDLILRLLFECSSIQRLTSTISWLSRYVQWLRHKIKPQQKYLTSTEKQRALCLIIKTVQSIEFDEDIQHLKTYGKLRNVSKLSSLNAYIDSQDGLLKVGRLNNSLLSQATKHPIILSSQGRLTDYQQQQARDNVITNSTEPKRPSRRTTAGPLKTLYFWAMMLFMFALPNTQCSYNISIFKNNQNVYFDKMYDINLIRDDWKLIVYYNMSTYWSAIGQVRNYVTHMEAYLHASTVPTQYKSIILQIQHELSEVYHYNKILKNKVRRKRGLVDGVGYLANTLFGTLDQRFAKNYEKDIEKISANENHLRLLLKNQTSIIEAQHNILQRNEGIMNKQFKLVQRYLEDVTSNTNRMEKITNDELHILSSSLSAFIVINNIRNMQESVITIITDLAQGHLDPHFLPPEQLEDQINIIYSHIPNELTLPVDRKDFKEIYKLMKIRSHIGASYLIIEIKIPLVTKDNYELDKVISLPQESYTLKFGTPYIAFNLQKDLLLTLTEYDIQKCAHLQTNRLLCSIDKPIFEKRITEAICNMSLHNQTMCSAITESCRVQWIKLQHYNKWLYSCCGKCMIRIFCPESEVIIKTLTGNGIIEIDQGCFIKGDTFSILSHNNYLSHTTVQENIPTLPDGSILNSILNFSSSLERFTNISEDSTMEWQRVNTAISSLKEQEDIPLSIHDIHQYSVLYSILGLVIATGLVYTIMRCKNKISVNLPERNTTTEPDLPLEPIETSSVEMEAVPPRTRPRAVRLDIPVTSAVH